MTKKTIKILFAISISLFLVLNAKDNTDNKDNNNKEILKQEKMDEGMKEHSAIGDDEPQKEGHSNMADMGEDKDHKDSMVNTLHPLIKNELEQVRIDEKVGNIIDDNITFHDDSGKEILFKDYIGDKPIVLSFGYYTCPLLCQFVFQAQKKLFTELDLKLGNDYKAITLSFDKRDNLEATQKAKATYTKGLSVEEKKNWSFLYGEEENTKKLTSQLGFYYNWIESTQEFAHTAAIYVISPKGKISRYFYGIEFNQFDVKLALIEAKLEKSKSTGEKVLMFCYGYDSDSRGYALQAKNVMKAGGVFTMFSLGVFFLGVLRVRKKKK